MSRSDAELLSIFERLNPLARKLLTMMKPDKSYLASQLPSLLEEGTTQANAVGAVGWLIANRLAQEAAGEQPPRKCVSLASKGETFWRHGLPEARVIELLRKKSPLTIKVLCDEVLPREELNPILGNMKKEGIIKFESGGRVVLAEEAKVAEAEKRYQQIKNLFTYLAANPKTDLKKMDEEWQQIVKEMSRKRGKAKAVFRIIHEVDRAYELTSDGEKAQKWGREEEGRASRKYDIETRPPKLSYGRKHPYGLFLDFVRKKLIAMGFEEMEGKLVEAEFWNNDALFMPQDHPAREIHDVYLIKEPKYSKELPNNLVKKVAETHKSGGKTGSTGWGYEFDKRRTARFVLRSQGTANSARMLASVPKVPGKYFAIARCFRYDRVDSTHAPDFYQIEGIVISPQINFRHLLGLLKLFALEIAGSEEVKFTPYYFPFTEPSVEVHFKHQKLGWMELGGAGIFRKEVTLPLGIDLPVIAWGLGLDRMAMVALSINDIRDLFTSDLGKIREMKLRR